MKLLRNLPIYYKIIFTFLLVIIPLYALNLLLNERSNEALRQEILGSMSSRVHFYTESLERDLDNLYSLQNNLALDRRFQYYGIAGNYISSLQKRDLIYDIQRQLFLIKSSNHYITDVRIHFFQIGSTISSNVLFEDLDISRVEPLLRADHEESLLYMNDSLFLRMTYPEPLISTGKDKVPLFLIETEISIKALEAALSEFSINGPETVFLTNKEKDWMISNRPLELTWQRNMEEVLNTRQEKVFQTIHDGNEYLVASEQSNKYQFSLMSYAPEDAVIRPVKEIQIWFWRLSVLTLVIVLLFSYSINLVIHKPIKTLIRSFRMVQAGRFDVLAITNNKDEFYYLYNRFNRMVEQINHLIGTVYQQKIKTQQAELKQLQSQINPHFLYNSLFVMHQMVVMQDYDNLEHFSKNLSDYFKMITRNAVQEVPLEEEVGYAKNYVSIQEFRFSNRVKVFFEEIPEEVRLLKVPRLILQPVIENAFQHGMNNIMDNGVIEIRFLIKKELLSIMVVDNGEGITPDRLDQLQSLLDRNNDDLEGVESTGIINVHQRLLLRFGPPAGIVLKPVVEGGIQIIMTIPVEEE